MVPTSPSLPVSEQSPTTTVSFVVPYAEDQIATTVAIKAKTSTSAGGLVMACSSTYATWWNNVTTNYDPSGFRAYGLGQDGSSAPWPSAGGVPWYMTLYEAIGWSSVVQAPAAARDLLPSLVAGNGDAADPIWLGAQG